MQMKQLVLDANILIRAALGQRVLALLKRYEDSVAFCVPDVCFADARKYIPGVAARRRIDPEIAFNVLDKMSLVVQSIDRGLYEADEASAVRRIGERDMADWPVVATALLLNCPIWTEDQDFFGCGVATWTAATVEHYLETT